MAGHNKWSSIKHRKAAVDAKKGKAWAKIVKEITVSARLGGGDPDANPRLRTAIQAAKQANMPNDNLERAIKKGTGELEGEVIEEVAYEGYGPGGVAILVKATTDNKNRTVGEVRAIFGKKGGSMGESGCVAWMFDPKGYLEIPKDAIDEHDLMEVVLEAGAEDMKTGDENYEITTAVEAFEDVRKAVEAKGLEAATCELTMIPQNNVELDEDNAKKLFALLDGLEDQDDVQKVYANFEVPDDVMEKVLA